MYALIVEERYFELRLLVRTDLSLSPYAKELLRTKKGYRCESYSGSNVRDARTVLQQEVLEQGNEDMIQEVQTALNLSVEKVVKDPASSLKRIFQEIDYRFGPDAVAIWLGCRSCVIENYCEPEEEPDEYRIPDSAVVISDLGDEGQLFLMPKKDFES
jgi:hypothetical protein